MYFHCYLTLHRFKFSAGAPTPPEQPLVLPTKEAQLPTPRNIYYCDPRVSDCFPGQGGSIELNRISGHGKESPQFHCIKLSACHFSPSSKSWFGCVSDYWYQTHTLAILGPLFTYRSRQTFCHVDCNFVCKDENADLQFPAFSRA